MQFADTNLNHYVRFRLLPEGERIWREYWEPYSGGRDPMEYIKPDADGWRQEQIWQVMTILGRHLHNGVADVMETAIQVQVS